MSESRALAVLEVLVHLAVEIPDKYVIGIADIPADLEISTVSDRELLSGWRTPLSSQQMVTRQIGDNWARNDKSAVLSVPSVIVDERNFVLNPAHPHFRRIKFQMPEPFEFDGRFFERAYQ
jgi:RES domain-containing protein